MSIDKISGSNHNNTEKIIDSQNLKKHEGIKGKLDTSKEDIKLKNVDKVEISSEVKELDKTLSILKSKLKSIPDLREQKLRDVKARIESGFYDSDENLEKIADTIRKSGLRPLGT